MIIRTELQRRLLGLDQEGNPNGENAATPHATLTARAMDILGHAMMLRDQVLAVLLVLAALE